MGAFPPQVQLAGAIVMLIGAANFIVVTQVVTGKGRRMRGVEDRETLALLLLVPFVGGLLWLSTGAGDLDKLPAQLFNAASLLSTNGLRIGETPQLTPVLVTVVIGGAAVSTAGGIKLLRWLVTFRRAGQELWRLTHPGGVGRHRASVDEFGVWIHTIAFTILLAGIVLVTAFFGNSLEVSAAAAAAAVANAGPVLGYAPLTTPDWVLFDPALRPVFGAAMIAGRLELVVVLALFSRRFWQA
jgi:trk system potassium uptake protein TrkH